MNLHREITKAVSAHGGWKTRLARAIVTKTSEIPVEAARVDDRCEFGRFLRAQADPKVKGSPRHAECLRLHRLFHAEAGRVLALALEGKDVEALRAVGADGEYARLTAALTAEMTAWADEAAAGESAERRPPAPSRGLLVRIALPVAAATAATLAAGAALRLGALWSGAAAVLVPGALLAYLLGRASAGLREMTDAAARLAEGDASRTVSYRSGDELGELADALRGAVAMLKERGEAVESLSQGRLTVTLGASGPRDVLGHAVLRQTAALQGLLAETAGLTALARMGELDSRADAAKFPGAYAEIVAGINALLDALLAPIGETAKVLERVAAKDVTARMTGEHRGAFAVIKADVNRAAENLDASLQQIAEASEHLSTASGEVGRSAQSLASGSSEAASSLEEISSSVQEASSMSKQTAANAHEAKGLAEAARAFADKGLDGMRNLSAAMSKIRKSSAETAKIVKTIDEIAFQTNLLALNAAVEAARAGDAGRGFAVVAEEVRTLATRSAEAAKSTTRLIENSVRDAEDGAALNADVLQSLDAIHQQAKKVGVVMAEIAAAAGEQTEGISQIDAAIQQINQVTQQGAANSEEMAGAAEELSAQALQLKFLVGRFRVSAAKEKDAAAEAFVSWSADEYGVGVQAFDAQHQELFRMINELYAAMAAGSGGSAQAGRTIAALADYAKEHFGEEEAAMRKTAYPDFVRHKAAHDKFVHEVAEFKAKYDAGTALLTGEILDFLKDWLLSHIKTIDRSYSAYLNQRGVR
ncbi:MAG: bacteriohemerythrin [Elusimicrobia bacterium]|nr:bacteriohemerythrin [Elusimicrobiota bacterium]